MTGTYQEGDWLDAVVVAVNHLKETTAGTKCVSKRIVLISDLGCPANDSKFDVIKASIKKEGIELNCLYEFTYSS